MPRNTSLSNLDSSGIFIYSLETLRGGSESIIRRFTHVIAIV